MIRLRWGACNSPSGSGHRSWLDRLDQVLAGLEVGERPAETGETIVEGDLGAVVVGVAVAACGVCLPHLDEGVLDRLPVAVEDLAGDPDPFPGDVGAGQHVLALGAEPEREIWAEGLRRRLAEPRHH